MMPMSTILRSAVPVSLVCGLLAACSSAPSTTPASTAPAVTADTWAVVDGRTITRDAVDKAYLRLGDPNQTLQGEAELAAKLSVLNDLIIQDLLLAKGKALNIEPAPAEVEAAFAAARKDVPDDQFQQELIRRRLTVEEMREALRRELVTQKVIEREVASKVVVSDQDVSAYFDANRAQFNVVEESHRLAQIVITPTRDARIANRTGDDATTPEAASAKVEMIMGRLKGGASFAELAADYSEDPDTAPRGGDLGLVPRSQLQQAPPALRSAVERVAPGTVNVVSAGGGHIIVLVLAHEAPGQRDLSTPDVRENITEALKARREQLLRAAYLTALRDEAQVQNYLARRIVESQGKTPALGPAAPGTN